MWWHKTTDNDKVLAFLIPTEIMNRPFESTDFVDLFILIIEDIESILSIVRFSCWIIISLKLHEELIWSGTKLYNNLFSLFDAFLVEGVFGFMSEENQISRVGFFVQKESSNHKIISFTNFANFKEFDGTRLKLSLQLPIRIVYFNDLRVVTETFLIVRCESNKWVTLFQEVVCCSVLFKFNYLLHCWKRINECFSFIGVYFVKDL